MIDTNPGGSLRPRERFLELDGSSVSRYLWVGEYLKGCNILDVGCGHGYGSYYLARHIARAVKGIDVDSSAIQFAKQTYRSNNLDFGLLDLISLSDFSASKFDAAVSFEVIEHFNDARLYLESINHALHPGASFFISTPNKKYTEQFEQRGVPTNPYHLREYYPAELRDLLAEYFDIVCSYVQFAVGDSDLEAVRYNRRLSFAVLFPKPIRRILKEFPNRTGIPILDVWVRLLGGPSSRKMKTSYSDYRIEEVSNIEGIDKHFPTQLYRLKKKNTS